MAGRRSKGYFTPGYYEYNSYKVGSTVSKDKNKVFDSVYEYVNRKHIHRIKMESDKVFSNFFPKRMGLQNRIIRRMLKD